MEGLARLCRKRMGVNGNDFAGAEIGAGVSQAHRSRRCAGYGDHRFWDLSSAAFCAKEPLLTGVESHRLPFGGYGAGQRASVPSAPLCAE